MQPFGAVEKIKENYQRYVETSFPLADDSLREQFRHLIMEDHLLWQEPFVSLSRPFKPGGTLENPGSPKFAGAGIIGEKSSPQWAFLQPYHQQSQDMELLPPFKNTPSNTP